MGHRLLSLLYESELIAVRVLLAIAEATWAIALLWPGETFMRPTYLGMQRMMPEEAWGVLFIASCFGQVTVLLTKAYHSLPAVVFAGWNSLLWLFCVLSMYMSVYPPPAAISGELALALGASWVFVCSGVPAQKAEASTSDPSHAHNLAR
jgi:hypothetical protein